jgi:peptide deformylase
LTRAARASIVADMDTPPIVKAGHPVLRAAARRLDPAEIATQDLRALVRAMVAAMRAAPGVGLAAPQIGVGLAVIVLEDHEDLMTRLSPEQRRERGRVPIPLRVIVNPELSLEPGPRATFFEGCLSVPGYMALVDRAETVRVRGLDEHGAPVDWTARGWPARILQHEVDHLNGTLYVDRMITRTLCENGEVKERWLDATTADVKRALGAA